MTVFAFIFDTFNASFLNNHIRLISFNIYIYICMYVNSGVPAIEQLNFIRTLPL